MTARVIQRAYPWLIGGLSTGIYVVVAELRGEPTLAEWSHEFLSNVVDVAAISIGFIMATMGIIFGMEDRPSIAHLKAGGRYNDLIGFMYGAAVSSILLGVVSIAANAGMLINLDLSAHRHLHVIAVGLWLGLAMLAAATLYRMLSFFAATLRYKEPTKTPLGGDPTA